jgi:hypothetical protein
MQTETKFLVNIAITEHRKAMAVKHIRDKIAYMTEYRLNEFNTQSSRIRIK